MIYLYLDESGDFGEGLASVVPGQRSKASLVGGVCGSDSNFVWEKLLRECVEKFDQKERVRFHYPSDFHCTELNKGEPRSRATSSEKLCQNFADAVFHKIVASSGSLFRVISRNDSKVFAYSRQATYGINLIAALRAALDELAGREKSDPGFHVDELHIVIARRPIGETSPNLNKPTRQDNSPYAVDLINFLRAQMPYGAGPGTKLASRLAQAGKWHIRLADSCYEPGLMAADFVCNHFWNNRHFGTAVVLTHPDEEIFGNYQEFCHRSLQQLLGTRQFTAAAHLLWRNFPPQRGKSTDFEKVLTGLRTESDVNVLARELTALLGFCRYLIERRTAEPGALAAAREFLEALTNAARQTLTRQKEAGVRREWAGMLVDGLSDLLACVNHLGATSGESAIQAELDAALNLYAGLLPRTYTQRHELQLEARNRNLNRLFNDYDFVEVINDFEKELAEREKSLPAGTTDELLGKMQGSVGQAYAFLARGDAFWAEPARESFERSIAHFQSGTFFHSVSVNYLATLAWQAGDLDAACRRMSDHAPRLLPIAGPGELAARLHEYVSQPDANAFDIVNYLRLAALGAEKNIRPGMEVLRAVAACVEPKFHAEHPHEQVAKWLAYSFHLAGDHVAAARLCRRGVEICRPLDFTVHTIGLSITGLEAVCQHAIGDLPAYGLALAAFQAEHARLAAASVRFQQYLTQVGDPVNLEQEIETGTLSIAARIVRLPPFTYA